MRHTHTISRIPVDKRTMTIMVGKTKCIAMAILFSCIALVFMASGASAQEDKKERGYNGCITIKELLSKFKRGEIVKGYIIDGDDIIKIIRTTRHAIKIEDSIIEDGLDFQKLPKIPLDKIKLPRDWDKEKRDEFIKKRRTFGYPFIHNVKNEIQIINSEIKSKKEDVPAVQAKSTIFYNGVNFNRTTFSGGAYFLKVTFSRPADFSAATFSGKADFFDATFSRGAYFSAATFSEKAYFSGATFSEKAYFSGATFSGEADFFDATFSGGADFLGATFTEYTNFKSAIFGGNAVFMNVKFAKIDFGSSYFAEEALFINATFAELVDFGWAKFSENMSFENITFPRVYFEGVTFVKDVDFSYASFIELADFSYATFEGKANFSWVNFYKLSYFQGAIIDALVMDYVSFKEFADFRDTFIRTFAFMCTSPTIVNGRLDFRRSMICEAHFQDIIFENDVDFSDVKFGIPLEGKTVRKLATVFRFVTFESDAYFIRTEFHSDTAFERIKFKGDANFTDIAFKDFKRGDTKRFSLSYLTFKHLLLSMDDLPDIQHWVREDKDRIQSFVDMEDNKANKTGEENLQPLTKVLYSLKEVFRSQNNLNDANKAHYYRKLMEFEDASKKKTFCPWALKEAEWMFWGLSCGYGTKVWWIVGWSGFFLLVFAGLYSIGGGLTRKLNPKTEQDFSFRQRLLDFPKEYLGQGSKNESGKKFINALRFSSVVLFKIGYRDTTISGKILGVDYKCIVWIEWLLGYYLLGALVVTLSNTLPIVHRLISGIF